MQYGIALQEVREVFTGELWLVVAHELLLTSVMCELASGGTHLQDFGPLAARQLQ